MCIEIGCKTTPSFNFKNEKKPLYCYSHKKDYMINVIHPTCIHPNCNKRPCFNFANETKALYCSAHKEHDMIDIKNKKCIHPKCNTRANFNFKNETKPLYCSNHKKHDMIDIGNKKCIHLNCTKQPIFNFENQTKALYCFVHKADDMIDIKHKRCIHPKCNKRPCFNFANETKVLYCSSHKKTEMIDIKNPKCIHPNCNIRPNFNIAGLKKALYCSSHKTHIMVDVKHPTCKNTWCFTMVKQKYNGYCLFCYINLFPEKPVSRNYKTKEYNVVEYIKTQFPNFTWITDRKIDYGCSKRRPDLLLDLGYQIIIIEIDENQHIQYDCSCDNKRIMELSQDLQHRPIVFIRFNPDNYKENGITISSCWGINKKGICVVKKSKIKEWNHRLNALESEINYWTNPSNTTNKTVEIIQLFYDV